MKKRIILSVSVVIISFLLNAALPLPVSAKDKKNDDEIKALAARIETLEKKVKEQDAKIEELSRELDKAKNPMFAIPKLPDSGRIPKGGKPFRFNGQTYYMVPVKDSVQVK